MTVLGIGGLLAAIGAMVFSLLMADKARRSEVKAAKEAARADAAEEDVARKERTLVTQNEMIKDIHTRAQARVKALEAQIHDLQAVLAKHPDVAPDLLRDLGRRGLPQDKD